MIRYSLNEAKFLEILSNEYVTKYYNSFEKDKIIYIIIEFMNNGTIRNYIDSFDALKIQIPEKIIWNLLLQSMSGLCYIHSKNIIHRDIPFRLRYFILTIHKY
jgi:serine/threonine protein kinase